MLQKEILVVTVYKSCGTWQRANGGVGSRLGTETHANCIRVRRALSHTLPPNRREQRHSVPLQTFTYRHCSGRSGRWAARGRRQRYQGICRECGRLPPEPLALPRCGGLHYVRGLSLVVGGAGSWRQELQVGHARKFSTHYFRFFVIIIISIAQRLFTKTSSSRVQFYLRLAVSYRHERPSHVQLLHTSHLFEHQ